VTTGLNKLDDTGILMFATDPPCRWEFGPCSAEFEHGQSGQPDCSVADQFSFMVSKVREHHGGHLAELFLIIHQAHPESRAAAAFSMLPAAAGIDSAAGR